MESLGIRNRYNYFSLKTSVVFISNSIKKNMNLELFSITEFLILSSYYSE